MDRSAADLNASSAQAFRANSDVQDLLGHIENGMVNAKQLGDISSNLGKEASSQMTSKLGDRNLGIALFKLRDHVDNLIGDSIADPELSTRYASMLPQYRAYAQLTSSPSVLNSATGNINFTALGKYLQRYDKPGYLRGGNDSDLYNGARWGQATGQGAGPPPLSKNLGLNWLAYQSVHNPAAGFVGGVAARGLAPVRPLITPGLQGLGIMSTQTLAPYLTE